MACSEFHTHRHDWLASEGPQRHNQSPFKLQQAGCSVLRARILASLIWCPLFILLSELICVRSILYDMRTGAVRVVDQITVVAGAASVVSTRVLAEPVVCDSPTAFIPGAPVPTAALPGSTARPPTPASPVRADVPALPRKRRADATPAPVVPRTSARLRGRQESMVESARERALQCCTRSPR